MLGKDHGFEAFIEGVLRQKGTAVVAGVFGEAAKYAAANEFGTDTIPQRSFIRAALDERGQEALDEYAARVRGSAGFDRATEGLAETMAAIIRQKIATGPFTPNAPATIKRKGEGKPPLIDTGELLKSVKGEVRRGQ